MFSPDAKEMTAFVAEGKVGKAEYWAEAGGAEAPGFFMTHLRQSASETRSVLPMTFHASARPHIPPRPALCAKPLTTLTEDGEIETLAKAMGRFVSIYENTPHLYEVPRAVIYRPEILGPPRPWRFENLVVGVRSS